jgi:hypothetical protein
MRTRVIAFFLLALVLTPSPSFGEGRKKKIWKISAAILGAVTIADVHSSVGRPEMNPLLRSSDGRFSGRGISLKSAFAGGAIAAQYFLLRKNPEAAGWAAGANFAAAAATGAVVVRNHRIR